MINAAMQTIEFTFPDAASTRDGRHSWIPDALMTCARKICARSLWLVVRLQALPRSTLAFWHAMTVRLHLRRVPGTFGCTGAR